MAKISRFVFWVSYYLSFLLEATCSPYDAPNQTGFETLLFSSLPKRGFYLLSSHSRTPTYANISSLMCRSGWGKAAWGKSGKACKDNFERLVVNIDIVGPTSRRVEKGEQGKVARLQTTDSIRLDETLRAQLAADRRLGPTVGVEEERAAPARVSGRT
jgi:hypothetical protein